MLADQHVPRASVVYLRSRDFDVLWIAEASPGVGDPVVLARGGAEARLTFGFDLDLPERIVRGTDAPPLGLVLFRGVPETPTELGNCSRSCCFAMTETRWAHHGGDRTAGAAATIPDRPLARFVIGRGRAAPP